jgi:hypothetical protein
MIGYHDGVLREKQGALVPGQLTNSRISQLLRRIDICSSGYLMAK